MASRVIKDKIITDSTLNDRQRKFCIEYLIDLNGTQAYIRAYGEDTDPITARTTASNLLAKPSIKKYINDVISSYADNCDVTVAEIVKGLKNIIIDPNARNSDRIKCYDLLAKYKGMLVEHKDITSNGSSINVTLDD